MHTVPTLPYLGQLLESNDSALQKSAVIGLAWFANGVGIQTPQGMASLQHLNSAKPTAFTTPDTQKYFGFDQAVQLNLLSFGNGGGQPTPWRWVF